MSDSRIVVFRSYDPTRIELVEAQLGAAQITFTRVGRGHAALLGAGNTIVEQLIEVAPEDAEQASALLAPTTSGEPEAQHRVEEPASPARMAFVAAGASLLWPGLGAAYVGLPLTGLALALWALFALILASGVGDDPLAVLCFGHLLLRLVDLVGAQLWLRRRGRRGTYLVGQVGIAVLVLGASFSAQRLLGAPLAELVARLAPAPPAAWPFDQAPNVAALADRAVADGREPVLLVIHHADDHSWAFLSHMVDSEDELITIGMQAALELDPTLSAIADLPPGYSASRERVGGAWTAEATDEE